LGNFWNKQLKQSSDVTVVPLRDLSVLPENASAPLIAEDDTSHGGATPAPVGFETLLFSSLYAFALHTSTHVSFVLYTTSNLYKRLKLYTFKIPMNKFYYPELCIAAQNSVLEHLDLSWNCFRGRSAVSLIKGIEVD
jgi:hypothetical protein